MLLLRLFSRKNIGRRSYEGKKKKTEASLWNFWHLIFNSAQMCLCSPTHILFILLHISKGIPGAGGKLPLPSVCLHRVGDHRMEGLAPGKTSHCAHFMTPVLVILRMSWSSPAVLLWGRSQRGRRDKQSCKHWETPDEKWPMMILPHWWNHGCWGWQKVTPKMW